MAQVLPGAAGMLVRLIAAAAVLLYIEPRLAAVILPAGAVLALLATVFRRTLKRLHKQIQESDGRLRVYLQESLSSLLVVRIFDRRQAVSREADARMDAHRADRMRRTRFSNLCNVGFSGAMVRLHAVRRYLLRQRHPPRHHELRRVRRRTAAHHPDTGALRQPHRLSPPLLCHAGQRRPSP